MKINGLQRKKVINVIARQLRFSEAELFAMWGEDKREVNCAQLQKLEPVEDDEKLVGHSYG